MPSRPPPGAEPFGYWSGDQMTVSVPGYTSECMRDLIYTAAVRMGDISGVLVTLEEYDLPEGTTSLAIEEGEVVVLIDPSQPAHVAASTTPARQSGGWLSAAMIGYAEQAECNDYWLIVLMHEFGHVYGLKDTRDREDALMHYRGTAGTWLRDWELEHLRRRIDNAD